MTFLSRENSQKMSFLRVKFTEANKRYQKSRVENRFSIFDIQNKSRMIGHIKTVEKIIKHNDVPL